MKFVKLAGLLFALILSVPSVFAKDIKLPKGFTKKVYDATYALYSTSEQRHRSQPKFLCTVTAFQKYAEGYLLIGAGHCTPAADDMPSDMEFFIESDINTNPEPVKLIKAECQEDLDGYDDPSFRPSVSPIDYAVFYWKTKNKIPVFGLGDEGSLGVGDKVVNVNFSSGEAKYVSPGVVDSKVAISGPMLGFYGVEEFASHGASGSSVIDLKTKKIVGLVIAGSDGKTLPVWIEPITVIEKQLAKADFGQLIQHPDIQKKVERPQEEGEMSLCL